MSAWSITRTCGLCCPRAPTKLAISSCVKADIIVVGERLGIEGTQIGLPEARSRVAVLPACCNCMAIFAPWRCARRATPARPGMKSSCETPTWNGSAVPAGKAIAHTPIVSRPAPPWARAS
jgi:hypothetical protein